MFKYSILQFCLMINKKLLIYEFIQLFACLIAVAFHFKVLKLKDTEIEILRVQHSKTLNTEFYNYMQ